MAITREQLMDMLTHLRPWEYDAGDWRRIEPGKKLVRFVAWSAISKKKGTAS